MQLNSTDFLSANELATLYLGYGEFMWGRIDVWVGITLGVILVANLFFTKLHFKFALALLTIYTAYTFFVYKVVDMNGDRLREIIIDIGQLCKGEVITGNFICTLGDIEVERFQYGTSLLFLSAYALTILWSIYCINRPEDFKIGLF